MHKTKIIKAVNLLTLNKSVEKFLDYLSKLNKEVVNIGYLSDKILSAIIIYK